MRHLPRGALEPHTPGNLRGLQKQASLKRIRGIYSHGMRFDLKYQKILVWSDTAERVHRSGSLVSGIYDLLITSKVAANRVCYPQISSKQSGFNLGLQTSHQRSDPLATQNSRLSGARSAAPVVSVNSSMSGLIKANCRP